MKITFITGGARSGKSKLAENTALKTGQKVIYLATAQALDEEMANRIKIHQQRRPDNWTTIEEPRFLSRVLKDIRTDRSYESYDIILIDCLALLVFKLASPGKGFRYITVGQFENRTVR
ncbi:MAG: bifunctional adenosylcobinamide kinase/adenosylcobinamide-phosphate guanylyltransferase [Tepidanaerobacteraceae bacterium]